MKAVEDQMAFGSELSTKQLPIGWHDISIGDVVGIQNGYAFKTKDFRKSGIPLVKQTNLVGDTVSLDDCQFLEPNFLKEKESFILNNGDILIGMSGSLGKVSVYRYDFPALQNQRTGKIKFYSFNNLSPPFFLYYFTNIAYILEKSGKGCGVQNISGGEIEALPFPLPPLNEQKRIVAKLDAIMPRIEAVKARLDRVPGILKRFRQSVLTAAVTGKLTEQWREEHPEVESAEALLDRIQRIDKQEYSNSWREFEIPETWICVHLKNIADLRLGKMLDESKNKGQTVKYLRNVNVRWFGFDLTDLKEIKITETEKKSLSVQIGDVFICEGGEPGRAAIWRDHNCGLTFQKALHRARMKTALLPDLLVYNLKVDADLQKLDELFTGSTIKHFTGRSLAVYPIPLPPLDEQKEIVRQVDKLFALADKVEAHYQKAKAKVDKLSQSVLAKAFRGELVPQNPNDEPAEKLLERIREEKARMEAELKGAKKRGSKK